MESQILIPAEVTFKKVTSAQLEVLVHQLDNYLQSYPLEVPCFITDMIGFEILEKLYFKLCDKWEKTAYKGTEKLSIKLSLYELLFVAHWVPIPERGNILNRQIFSRIILEAMKYEYHISIGVNTERKRVQQLSFPENNNEIHL